MKFSVTATVVILSCIINPKPSAAEDWPPADVCGDMDLIGTNINGVDCVFCASTSPDCAVACTGTGVCVCRDDPITGDVDMMCCKENPCCGGCPDPKPKSCFVSNCFAEPSDCGKTVCPDPQPPTGYVHIEGKTSNSGTKMCWELRNGSTRKENKIILAKCHHKNDAQKFKLSAVLVNDKNREGLSVMIHPKLDPSKVVVGVREAAEKGWLRVEQPQKAKEELQAFTALDNGRVRLGTQEHAANNYLFVTNQGLKANKGDPVMLTTSSRLERFEKNGDVILSWEFV